MNDHGHVCVACAIASLGSSAGYLRTQLDALLDELTVATLEHTQPARGGYLSPRARARSRAFAAWPAIEQRLQQSPARSNELAELAFGPPNKLLTFTVRQRATDAMMHRLVVANLVVRLRRGVFALPNSRHRVTTRDSLRIALRIARQPPTVPELATQLDVSVATVYRWLRQLLAAGEPIHSTLVPGTTRPIQRWQIKAA